MNKNLKIRLYPTLKQKQMLDDHFNAYRFCYNLCLEYKSHLWRYHQKSVSGFDMQKELFEIRKETNWLIKCKAECLRDSALNVENSYKRFFNGSGFPKYKSKHSKQAFAAYQNIVVKGVKLSFYRSKIKFNTSEHYQKLLECHKIKQCIFTKDKSGNYWATCLIDSQETKVLPKTENQIGIDLGIKDLVITSEGEVFENKRYLQNQYYKLRRLQRRHAKSIKGGKNREKLRVQIAKSFIKINNQKQHYYHQITNQLLSDNQTIIIETLNISGMIKNRNMCKSISDVSWRMFMKMLDYKAEWYGREVIKVDRWFPSSKTCSGCGNVKEKFTLSERTYNCDNCGLSIDRDLNAAINIKNQGIKIPGSPVEECNTSCAKEAGSKRLTIK